MFIGTANEPPDGPVPGDLRFFVMTDQVGISSAEVCRRAGVTYRQLDQWTRRGYVTPSIRSAAGSGTQRSWSIGDVVKVRSLAVRSADLRRGLTG